jgi:hypothetical protein
MVSTLINFIYLLSLVCWIGSIVFFSFFVAPVVFKTFEREQAGEVVGIIFSSYYMIGSVCGVLVLAALLLNETAGLKLCAWGVMMVGTVCAGLIVHPKAQTLKQQLKNLSEAEKITFESRFKTLHSLSVKLNVVVLFSGIWLLWLNAINMPTKI